MSNTSTFALGLGGGLALWYATNRERTSKSTPAARQPGATSTPPSSPTTKAPRNCAVRIDTDGITVDGARLDVAEAVRRCAVADHVALTVAPNAPASTCAALMHALAPPPTTIRNARRQTSTVPNAPDLSSTFTLVVFPEGVWGSKKRVRYFKAEPPTTWEDARDRLRAAKLIDRDVHGPNNAGAWRLVIDPARFRSELAEPLPGNPRPRGARGRQRYTHEGRTILRDGEAILRIDRVDLGDERYAVSPYEADRFTQRVVRLLNKHGAR